MGQEVKISDPVWKIVSLADNNNIAPPLAFVCGAWRPKADYLGGVGRRSPPTDIARGLGGGSPPAYFAYSAYSLPEWKRSHDGSQLAADKELAYAALQGVVDAVKADAAKDTFALAKVDGIQYAIPAHKDSASPSDMAGYFVRSQIGYSQ